jgi:hypothetical protein
MNAPPSSGLSLADLTQALALVEPAALLVPPRILRRVIKRHSGLTGPGLQVPHRKSYVIDRDALLRLVDREEAGFAKDHVLPRTLLLLEQPDPRLLASCAPEAVLLQYWRLLFHARIHLTFCQARAEGRLGEAAVRSRVHRLGLTEFDEFRAVLHQENFLLPPGDDRTVYEEFAALFLELRHFAPHLLPRYFPSVSDYAAVEAVLAEDVEASRLFAQTRLPGAAEPTRPVEQEVEEADAALGRLMAQADRAAKRGNVVRAAILRMRAVWATATERAEETLAEAYKEIERLTGRLQQALGFPNEERTAWVRPLMALLEPAARGRWTVEARLLYDLQKVCIDHEREVYAVDLVEWFVTWGRRPVKRRLPHQREVLMVKHLRGAGRRLTAVRLAEAPRRQLADLLQKAIHHHEGRLRTVFRPLVLDALGQVGLKPANYAEARSRDKLVEELLDRVVERGFLNMSDLRDAVARNRLKLPDLAGPRQFFLGDQLIRANRRFAENLDGVYHRGEIYLRWLQRLSSTAFGTRVGRWLTRYLVLPFGGAFFILFALQEIAEISLEVLGLHYPHQAKLVIPFSKAPAEAKWHTLYAVGVFGLFLFGLLYSAPFRRITLDVGRWLYRGSKALLYDVPRFVLHLPPVQALLRSQAYLVFYQQILKPLLYAAPVSLLLYLLGVGWGPCLGAGAAVFLALNLFLNSRWGLRIEEACTDWLVRTWSLIRGDLLPGLFRFVMYLFKSWLEDLERVLYAVDEWLRFRAGEGRFSLVAKAVLGLFWFFLTYAVRFVINLFVEPTFNPIKHFPVVTVTAKLLLPFVKELGTAIATPLTPFIGLPLAGLTATVVLFLLPGLAGFLVWELKENWRLYRSNQSPTLQAEIVGHHGETVLRWMKPGFHSGTLPKLFAKLRRNERRNEGRAARKQRLALHHVRERLIHFAERNFVAYLEGSRCWPPEARLQIADVALATNRLRIFLACPGLAEQRCAVDFEEHSGRLLAAIAEPGWLRRLAPEPARTLADALAGWYKMAGVDVVREEVAALLPSETHFDFADRGLVVWKKADANAQAVYPLDQEEELKAIPVGESPAADWPTLPAQQLFFQRVPIRWVNWVDVWERDQAGKGHEPSLLPEQRLLPG